MESKVTTFQISKHSHHHPTSRKVKSVQVHWFCHEKGRGGKPRADNAEVIFSSRAFSELQFSFLYYGFSQNYLHHNLVSNALVAFLTNSCKIMPNKANAKEGRFQIWMNSFLKAEVRMAFYNVSISFNL